MAKTLEELFYRELAANTISEIALSETFDISSEHVRKLINGLREKGVPVFSGDWYGQGTHYHVPGRAPAKLSRALSIAREMGASG